MEDGKKLINKPKIENEHASWESKNLYQNEDGLPPPPVSCVFCPEN